MSDSAGTATAARGDDGAPAKRERRPALPSRINTFIKQVLAELRKVIWPTRAELITYTSVVLVFVVIMVSIVAVFDYVFTQGVLAVFGK